MTTDAPHALSSKRLSPKARAGIAALGLAAAAAAGWLMLKRPPSGPTPVTGAGDTAVEVEDYGPWYDWVLAQGAVADGHRRLATTPLIEVLAGGQILPRLAKTYDYKEGVASVEIRDAVYWSDQTSLEAFQIHDGLMHARDGIANGAFVTPNETTTKLISMARAVEIDVTGPRTFTVKLPEGFTQADMQLFISSSFFLPVRLDLLAEEGGATKAWQTTIGAYKPAEEPKAKLPKASAVRYEPNPVYYRGVATTNTELKLPTSAASL